MQRQHSVSIEEARSKLGIERVGKVVDCPVCSKPFSKVRGAVIKHMMAAHNLSLEECRSRLGMVCKRCSKALPRGRHEREYCSNTCWTEASKEIFRNKIIDQTEDQKKRRSDRYYEALEKRYGRPIKPQNVMKYVESLGFSFREPYTRSTEDMKLCCPEGHNFTRRWSLFRDYPTCTVCGKIERFYTVYKLNVRLGELGYDLLTKTDFENGIVEGTHLLSVRCKKGHVYETPCMYVLRDQQVCPHCNKSKEEVNIANLLREMGYEVEIGNRSLISPHEVDIILHEQKLCVEFCGLYWHSEKYRPDPMYHRNKLVSCSEKGYRLLTVFSDEWYNRKNVCLSRIANAAGNKSEAVGARKCDLRKIETKEARRFFDEYHLQGSIGLKAAWGLFYHDRLVQCLALGAVTRKHTSTNATVELKRFASASDIRVQGGFSRLLKAASAWSRENKYKEIKSYCDLRWGTGETYKKTGFQLVSNGRPSPWYTDGHKRLHAATMRKKAHERLTGKTEAQLRAEEGYWRIWDCGHQTWVLSL